MVGRAYAENRDPTDLHGQPDAKRRDNCPIQRIGLVRKSRLARKNQRLNRVAADRVRVHCGAMEMPLNLTLTSPAETASAAAYLGGALQPGDTVLLDGEIGSGKTHFARALVQSVLSVPEDVPSPTFTLVQVYDTRIGEVWHSDLYRLSSVEEVEELGLIEAFETSICLIEWPEKLGALTPSAALLIRFSTDPEHLYTRHLEMHWTDPKWTNRLENIL